jgi:DNA-binding response OmpR family regulator
MNSHARVLVVSRDEMLLRSRQLILGAFFLVEGAGRFTEARAMLNSKSFDLIVLCHSLTSTECEQLAMLARKQVPRPQVLAMSASSRASINPWADKQLGVDAGPYGLVKKCAEMLGFVLKSKARTVHA